MESVTMIAAQRLFGLDPQLLFDAGVTAINVLILFALLSYLLFNPAKQMLERRKEKIASDLETAQKDKTDALTLKEEYDEKLRNVEKEAEVILSDARKKAMKNEDKIIAEAREEAARIIAHAHSEAELEKKKAADDIKKEIIHVATLMANKVIAVSIDDSMQDKLIEETLGEIGDSTWLN